ncbi:hypothetical protein CSB45_00835 [candidate division KSB3 bacterium]|uniref:Caspase family p20 domain-containing protein n=1 Tax=candidate division KSB3 bacterium TaxID=2044937 RepID=A0A2G6EC86_9BACT|nr:MAG: hypothetical protein CSB45_00835 [candidate division KSB3 bacterium]PIE28317.1 MAG: hypothetical protein CSA57_14480 [candidate division KSB3 bacterium]
MRKIGYCGLIGLALLIMAAGPAFGKRELIQDRQGETILTYEHSYALMIGVSHYTHWPGLPGVEQDMQAVRGRLEQMGFQVTLKENPRDQDALNKIFQEFIMRWGREEENRLLFYFAGHGETLPQKYGGNMGYLVAADAPLPKKDGQGFLNNEQEFLDHALDMEMIEVYAKRIQARHALFVFDSCFSGSIFSLSRAVPEHISYKTERPVRQFITSGSADEEVPDESVFRRQFLAALQGEGDVDNDGYVTGSELGLFLEKKVGPTTNGDQNPQYGKIRDPNLSKGDFVFALPQPSPTPTPRPATAPAPPDGQFSIEDLQAQTEWRRYQQRLEEAFAQARAFENRAAVVQDAIAAWQRFLEYAAQDNPYSDQDEGLRQQAHSRIAALRARPTATPASPSPSNAWTDPVTGMDFVWIPGGCFQMGQTEAEKTWLIQQIGEDTYNRYYDDELPRHKVCLEGFWLGKYEVTNAQYRQWKRDHDSGDFAGHSLNGDRQPVVRVSWKEATAFADWLTEQHHGKYTFRLPSEAQWEYAVRAGTTSSRFWGDDPDKACGYANVYDQTAKEVLDFSRTAHHCRDNYVVTAPVGGAARFEANAFGLYDMLGNVWEWCADSYEDSYDGASPAGAPRGTLGDGKTKVLRGGSWDSYPWLVRSAIRNGFNPDNRGSLIGFRLVVSPRTP